MNNLGPQPVADPAVRLSSARAAVMSYLVEVAMPVTVRQVAASSGQHANTVREHLDSLVEAGMVERNRIAPKGRGRPAISYRALPDATALHSTREYASLVDALAAHLARRSSDPAAESIEVGRAWGDQFESGTDVLETMQGLGFEPTIEGGNRRRLRLLTCPLLASARRNPEVVCNVHLGLMRELAGDGVELQPFVEGGCLVHLPDPD